MPAPPRALLRAMLDAAIAAAMPDVSVPRHLPEKPKGRTIVVGAGKASAAMARAFEKHWDGPLDGLIVTRYGHGVPCERIEIVEAAHPVPDDAGTKAAARMLEDKALSATLIGMTFLQRLSKYSVEDGALLLVQ